MTSLNVEGRSDFWLTPEVFVELISSWTIYFIEINKDSEHCHLLFLLFTFIKASNIRYFLIKLPFGITCY